jgi:hypothetical protein
LLTTWLSGKFHGVMAATTPTGAFTTLAPFTSSSQLNSSARRACEARWASGPATCIIWAILMGVPTSAEIVSASSSARALSTSAIRPRYLPRSPGAMAPHSSKAARAAATARSASSAPPAGTSAMTSSVAGLTTAMVSVASDATHFPPMKILEYRSSMGVPPRPCAFSRC